MRAIQTVMDRVTLEARNTTSFETPFGTIQIDSSHAPERTLAYCFHNFLSHYRNSPLGRYIETLDWNSGTFVDVGANLGMYSLLAQSLGAHALLFEPEPAHAAFLKRNDKIFGKLYPIALSDKSDGSLPLFYSPNNSGATSLVQNEGYIRSSTAIPISTFSQQQLGDRTQIKLVKIDVEGNEVPTVLGMRDFLKQGHRPDIWCEVRGGAATRSRNSCYGVIEALREYGYTYSVGVSHAESTSGGFDHSTVFDLLFVA